MYSTRFVPATLNFKKKKNSSFFFFFSQHNQNKFCH
jgi:hypothetical protein